MAGVGTPVDAPEAFRRADSANGSAAQSDRERRMNAAWDKAAAAAGGAGASQNPWAQAAAAPRAGGWGGGWAVASGSAPGPAPASSSGGPAPSPRREPVLPPPSQSNGAYPSAEPPRRKDLGASPSSGTARPSGDDRRARTSGNATFRTGSNTMPVSPVEGPGRRGDEVRIKEEPGKSSIAESGRDRDGRDRDRDRSRDARRDRDRHEDRGARGDRGDGPGSFYKRPRYEDEDRGRDAYRDRERDRDRDRRKSPERRRSPDRGGRRNESRDERNRWRPGENRDHDRDRDRDRRPAGRSRSRSPARRLPHIDTGLSVTRSESNTVVSATSHTAYPPAVHVPTSLAAIREQIEKKEIEKRELDERRKALAKEMGIIASKLSEIDHEITALHVAEGQMSTSQQRMVPIQILAPTPTIAPGLASAPTLATVAPLPTPMSAPPGGSTPFSPAQESAGEVKRKKKTVMDAREHAIDLTDEAATQTKHTAKKAKRPPSPTPQEDPNAPFELLKFKHHISIAADPRRDMLTGVFNRVPRALLKSPIVEMIVASNLEGNIIFLEGKPKKSPRVDLHATLSRDQLHGLPWAEDLDFIGTDLLAIAAAAKYRKGGQDTLAPYKLGILQVPTELKDPKSFTTTLYVPKFPNHLVEKHIKCVTSPQIVFDGDSVNGLRFVTGGADRRIILWHLTGLTPGLPGKPGEAVVSPKLLLTSSASIDAMAWNGRSQRLFSASGDQMMPYDMGSMKSLNPVKLKGSPSGISLNERTDDTLLLTLNTAGKNMALYDIRKEKIVLEFGFAEPSGKTNGHYRAALSPNGQLVASGNVFAADKMENWIWDLRWQGTKRDQPATIVKTQHKNAMQRFLWWNDKTYYSTSTGDGIEYVDLN